LYTLHTSPYKATQLSSVRHPFICIEGSRSTLYVWYVVKSLNAFPLFMQTVSRNLVKTEYVTGVWEALRVGEVNYFVLVIIYMVLLFFYLAQQPQVDQGLSFTRCLDHTPRGTKVGRTLLDERLARRRDLYMTTHNSHNRQISKPPCGIRTHNLSRRAAADLGLRPRGHWDRHMVFLRS